MKKMILIAIVMIASINVNAQAKFDATEIQTGTYNTYQKKWVMGIPQNIRMMVTFDDWDVYIDNREKTHLHLIGDYVETKDDGVIQTTWDAIDELKQKCQVMTVTSVNGQWLWVTYINTQPFKTISYRITLIK